MRAPCLIAAGQGELVGDAPDRRVEILAEAEPLHATWSRFGPGRDGADLHVHRNHTDLFYVLDGELTIRLGAHGRETRLPAGTLARVPPLVAHGFRNASDAEVRYLNLHAPGQGFAGFLRDLSDGREARYDQWQPPEDGGRDPGEARFGERLLGTERAGVRETLLADVEEIAIVELRADAGARAEPAHLHPRHLESLYVLEGQVTLRAGERELHASAGDWLTLLAGTPHRLSFSAAGVRLLEIHTPGSGFGGFLRMLGGGAGEDEQLAAERCGFDRQPAELRVSS